MLKRGVEGGGGGKWGKIWKKMRKELIKPSALKLKGLCTNYKGRAKTH